MIDARGQQGRQKPSELLRAVCAEWSILARYSSRSADIRQASEFLQKVRELKEVLHG